MNTKCFVILSILCVAFTIAALTLKNISHFDSDTIIEGHLLPQGSLLVNDANAYTGGLYRVDMSDRRWHKVANLSDSYDVVLSDQKGLLWRHEAQGIHILDIMTTKTTFLPVYTNISSEVVGVAYLDKCWIVQYEKEWIVKQSNQERKIPFDFDSARHRPVMFVDEQHLLIVSSTDSLNQFILIDINDGSFRALTQIANYNNWTTDSSRKSVYLLKDSAQIERWQWTGKQMECVSQNEIPRFQGDGGCERISAVIGTDWLFCQQNQIQRTLGIFPKYSGMNKYYIYNHATGEKKLVFASHSEGESMCEWVKN